MYHLNVYKDRFYLIKYIFLDMVLQVVCLGMQKGPGARRQTLIRLRPKKFPVITNVKDKIDRNKNLKK